MVLIAQVLRFKAASVMITSEYSTIATTKVSLGNIKADWRKDGEAGSETYQHRTGEFQGRMATALKYFEKQERRIEDPGEVVFYGIGRKVRKATKGVKVSGYMIYMKEWISQSSKETLLI